MGTITEKTVRNTSVANISFKPNHVILLKQTTSINTSTGEANTTIKYIEVCPVKDTKTITITMSVLRWLLADTIAVNEFKREFSGTGVAMQKIFNKYLSSNVIWRSNSDGQIVEALYSDIPLKNTAFNIKDRHTIMKCSDADLSTAIYNHAKAIASQCTHHSKITAHADRILNILETNETIKVAKTNPKSTPTTNEKKETQAA